MTLWEKVDKDGYATWTATTGRFSLEVIPELGAKIVSLKDLSAGREWMDQGSQLGNQGYGSAFAKGDLCGWDEMFPTIKPSIYPEHPWEGVEAPDHGEVWSIPWRCEVDQHALICNTSGIRFPYNLEKRLSFLDDRTLTIEYRLTNNSSSDFKYVWVPHPSFLIREGVHIVLPVQDGSPISFQATNDPSILAYPGQHTWPLGAGGEVALDTVPARNGMFYKFQFTDPLAEGWFKLVDPANKSSFMMEFPLACAPFFSIWQNYDGKLDKYQISLQPSTGSSDDLAEAIRVGRCAVLPANQSCEWQVRVILG